MSRPVISIAIACGALTVVGYFAWARQANVEILPLRIWNRPAYQLIHGDSASRQITGIRFIAPNTLRCERWTLEDDVAPAVVDIPLGQLDPATPVAWSADPTGHRLYWASGSTLATQLDDARTEVRKAPHADAPVIQIQGLADGSVMVVYADGFSQVWDNALATVLSERIFPVEPNARRLFVDGEPALVRDSHVVFHNQLLFFPGQVRAIENAGNGRLLAGGEFDGLMILKDGEEPRRVTGGVVSSLGWYGDRLLASGPGSVRLLDVSPTGVGAQPAKAVEHGIPWKGLGLVCLLVLLCVLLAKPVWKLWKRLLEGTKWIPGKVFAREPESKFRPPSDELVEAMARGEVCLWTGSGLSAQAYCPTRSQFLEYVLDRAEKEAWFPLEVIERAIQGRAAGKGEDVLDWMVRKKPQLRDRLIEMVRARYTEPMLMNASCYSIGKLPLACAVTTNYDCVLERLFEDRVAGTLRGRQRACEHAGA